MAQASSNWGHSGRRQQFLSCRFQSSSAEGGFGGGVPSGSGGASSGQAAVGGGGPSTGRVGAMAASAALMQGGVSRGAAQRNRNRVGPHTSGGSIGGSDLNGGFSVTSFMDTPAPSQVLPCIVSSKSSRRLLLV